MKPLAFVQSVGCVVSGIVLFPLVVIGGGAALFLVATGTELSHLITHTRGDGMDRSAAHQTALRICYGQFSR